MKKIVILTSRGGRGHLSATEALQQTFGTHYLIKPVFVFSEPLKSFDLAYLLTLGRWHSEDIYNSMLQRKWYGFINAYYRLGRFYFWLMRKQVKNLFKTYLAGEAPDLVISVVPLINGPLLDAVQELNVPLIILPTDLDSTSFVFGIEKPMYEKLRYCLAFNDSNMQKTVESAHFTPQQLHVTGFPLRKDFFEKKDLDAIKQRHQIPAHKPIILLMLGGLGSNDLIPFIKQLITIPNPVHVIACIGKSNHLKEPLEKLKLPASMSMSIVGFTNKMSDLMAVADLLITKSGSVSVCEGLYMNTPLLLDGTSNVLTWEQLNHHIIRKHHWGLVIKSLEELPRIVAGLLYSKERLHEMKSNMQRFDKKDARVQLGNLIKELIG